MLKQNIMPEEDKQIFTTYSFKEELRKKIKGLVSEVKDTLGIKVSATTESGQMSEPTTTLLKKTETAQAKTNPENNTGADIYKPVVLVSSSPATSRKVKHQEKNREKKVKIKKSKKQEKSLKISKEKREKFVLVFLGILIIGTFIFAIASSFKYLRLKPAPPQINLPKDEKIFCGGIANIECPAGFFCQLEGKHPDAGGFCVKGSVLNDL
jgi:hypothetical protein